MLWSTVILLVFLVLLLFENNDVIGAPDINLPWTSQLLSVHGPACCIEFE